MKDLYQTYESIKAIFFSNIWIKSAKRKCFLTEQIDDAVIVAGVQLDEIFEEKEEAGVYHAVVQVFGLNLRAKSEHLFFDLDLQVFTIKL